MNESLIKIEIYNTRWIYIITIITKIIINILIQMIEFSAGDRPQGEHGPICCVHNVNRECKRCVNLASYHATLLYNVDREDKRCVNLARWHASFLSMTYINRVGCM